MTSTNDLAIRLGLLDEELAEFQNIDSHNILIRGQNSLSRCADIEYHVESSFYAVLDRIGILYNLDVVVGNKVSYCVGGLLADPDLAVCGLSDFCFKSQRSCALHAGH